jgi:Zn-dependent membrane protease YugP
MERPSTDPSAPTARRGDTLLLRHSLSGVLRMGSQLLSMMILVPLIISYLGESRFGVWALGLALICGLSLLEMGLLQSANRFMSTIEAAQDPILFRETVCTAFWLTLPVCSILLAALPLGDLFIDG